MIIALFAGALIWGCIVTGILVHIGTMVERESPQ